MNRLERKRIGSREKLIGWEEKWIGWEWNEPVGRKFFGFEENESVGKQRNLWRNEWIGGKGYESVGKKMRDFKITAELAIYLFIQHLLEIKKPDTPFEKVNSYRPISLQPTRSKIFEKIFVLSMVTIPDFQFAAIIQQSNKYTDWQRQSKVLSRTKSISRCISSLR